MTGQFPLTVKAAAQRIGCTAELIRLRIRNGEVPPELYRRSPSPTGQERIMLSEQIVHLMRHAGRGLPQAPAPPRDYAAEAAADGELGYNGQTYEDSKAKLTYWQAEGQRLKVISEAGDLIRKGDAQAAYDREIAMVKARLLAIPREYKRKTQCSDAHRDELDEMIRDALTELSGVVASSPESEPEELTEV